MDEHKLHTILGKMADNLQEHVNTIVSEHPQDEEGFPVIADPDLSQALKIIDETISQLCRICLHISEFGIGDDKCLTTYQH